VHFYVFKYTPIPITKRLTLLEKQKKIYLTNKVPFL